MLRVVCPLCGARKARRACPALGKEICAVCCGTKRLTEIACPPDCRYLTASQEHPPAAAVRRQQHDFGRVARSLRDLDRSQTALYLVVAGGIRGHQPAVLQPLIDDDIVEAAEALAATFETAERGVIYEHRPASLPAERLMTALKEVLTEASKEGRPAFGRDAALVLRRIAEGAKEAHAAEPASRQAYLDLLKRVLGNERTSQTSGEDTGSGPDRRDKRSPLIVP